jgi:hypothetical protein
MQLRHRQEARCIIVAQQTVRPDANPSSARKIAAWHRNGVGEELVMELAGIAAAHVEDV